MNNAHLALREDVLIDMAAAFSEIDYRILWSLQRVIAREGDLDGDSLTGNEIEQIDEKIPELKNMKYRRQAIHQDYLTDGTILRFYDHAKLLFPYKVSTIVGNNQTRWVLESMQITARLMEPLPRLILQAAQAGTLAANTRTGIQNRWLHLEGLMEWVRHSTQTPVKVQTW